MKKPFLERRDGEKDVGAGFEAALTPLVEVSDPFCQPRAQLREFIGAENNHEDDLNNQQFRYPNFKHAFLL